VVQSPPLHTVSHTHAHPDTKCACHTHIAWVPLEPIHLSCLGQTEASP
jgi:hypothetical protein